MPSASISPPRIDGLLHGRRACSARSAAIEHVDQVSFIGLQAREGHAGQVDQSPRKFDGRRRLARRRIVPCRCRLQSTTRTADPTAAAAWEIAAACRQWSIATPILARWPEREPAGFRFADDLIGNQHVVEAVLDEHFRLTQRGAGHADRAGRDLPSSQRDALVVLEVWSQFCRTISKECRHVRQVPIAGGAVQHQRLGIDLGQRIVQSWNYRGVKSCSGHWILSLCLFATWERFSARSTSSWEPLCPSRPTSRAST